MVRCPDEMEKAHVRELDIGGVTKDSHSVMRGTPQTKSGWKRMVGYGARNFDGDRGYASGWLERLLNNQDNIFMLKVGEWGLFLVMRHRSDNVPTVRVMLTNELKPSFR